MTASEVIILAVVQGITEFLPVSSSGHLLAARIWLGISDSGGVAFDALLHLGTLGAVLAYYWKTWWKLGKSVLKPRGRNDGKKLVAALALATVPAAVAGYAFENVVESWFRTTSALAVSLTVTGAIILATDRWRVKEREEKDVNLKDAIIIGLAQVAALVPGVSRSGVTISAGRARGLSRQEAAKFSFLMSAPIIAGAGLAHVPGILEGGVETGATMLFVGLVVSFLSGLAAISWFVRLVSKVSLAPFAVYLFILSGLLVWYG